MLTTENALLANLMEGNSRFVEGKSIHPHQDMAHRKMCADEQHPQVAVVACADSRVAPCILFDQGLGDLFVTRVAGNVVNDMILGTLEYGVEHLGIKLIVVVGHKRCGAVSAALGGGELSGHLSSLLVPLQPAVESTRGLVGDPVDNACRENVRNMVERLRCSQPLLAEKVMKGELGVAGFFYDLDTGRVEQVK